MRQILKILMLASFCTGVGEDLDAEAGPFLTGAEPARESEAMSHVHGNKQKDEILYLMDSKYRTETR